jgi:hypothetical protein
MNVKSVEEFERERQNWRLYGELYLDAEGEAHFICHTKDDDFQATRRALKKFIALLQDQLDRERECPFFKPLLWRERRIRLLLLFLVGVCVLIAGLIFGLTYKGN